MQPDGQKGSKEEILEYATEKNALIAEDALELLKETGNFRGLIDRALAEGAFFIGKETIELLLPKQKIAPHMPEAVMQHTGFKPLAKETQSRLRLLKQYDVTGQSKNSGKVKDFQIFFQKKFELLSAILRKRHTLSPKPISRLKAVPNRAEVDVIGMVLKKWATKNGNIAMHFEDTEAKCIVIIPQGDAALTLLAEHIMLDDVIAIRAVKLDNDMLIAKEILWPDLPVRERKTTESNVAIATTSDMHVGSKLFLEKPFNQFLEWLNGRAGSAKEMEKAGKIKYLIISGDNVDGIGVYPNQFSELNIKDINLQYKEFSKFIMQIPEYIEVLICPGQHDAVRLADPQPAVAEQFVPELYKMGNIHFVGSPSWMEIEGLTTMVYHGAALHDLISSSSFLNYDHPELAMIEALKRRDLMSAYGLKHTYAPEKEDYMVIREEPDLVVLGDLHHNSYGNYRGTTVINNGTWQSRTPYQVKLGHIPTLGIVPVMDIKTGKITENHFIEAGDERQ